MGNSKLTVYLLSTLILASGCSSQNESGFSTDSASQSDSASNTGAGLVTTTTLRSATTTLRQVTTTTTLRPVTTTTSPQYVTTTTVRAATTTTLPRVTTTTLAPTTTTTTLPAQTACSTSFPLKAIEPVKGPNVKAISGYVYSDLNKNMSFDSGEGSARGSVYIGVRLGGTGNADGGAISSYFWTGDQTVYLSAGLKSGYITLCTNVAEDFSLDVVDLNTLVTSNSMMIEGQINSVRVKGSKGLKIGTHLGNQNLVGGPGDDILSSGDDADILKGGGGNDLLIGGNGIDMAVYTGRSSQYSVSRSGNDLMISGVDGSDTNRQIEIYRFSDGDFVYNSENQRLIALVTPTKTMIPQLGACSNSFPVSELLPVRGPNVKLVTGNVTLASGAGAPRGHVFIGGSSGGTGNAEGGVLSSHLWAGDQTVYLSTKGNPQYIGFCTNIGELNSLDIMGENHLATTNSMIVDGAISSLSVKGSNGLSFITNLGNQNLVGGPGQDKFWGGADADILDGRLGDDILDGGDGLDIAVYSGAKDQYTVRMSGGALTVSGANAGNDTLYAVEILRFSDGDYIYSQELGRVVSIK